MSTFIENVTETAEIFNISNDEAVVLELIALKAWCEFAIKFQLSGDFERNRLIIHLYLEYATGQIDRATLDNLLARVPERKSETK